MREIKTGGPAFPQAFAMSPKPDQGMTLRDYFAGQALAGIVANKAGFSWPTDVQAEEAFAIADAMLELRGEK